MPHLRKSCRSSRGSTKSSGPNTALEATGHSVGFVAGVGLYRVARASAWALSVIHISDVEVWVQPKCFIYCANFKTFPIQMSGISI
jgi:hypothetical protein